MRAVVQRVAQASVTGGGETAQIARGLCVLVGFEASDTLKERDALLHSLFKLKLFAKPADTGNDEKEKPWAGTVQDVEGEVLLVSQFTLNAVLKSGRPSFHRAMPPEPAREMWGGLVGTAKEMYPRVKCCVFGSMMNVSLVNEGPVTICLTSTEGKCTAW